MKKILRKGCLLLLCLLLVSCSANQKEENLYTDIEKILFSLSKSKDIPKANMDKKYYNYYLPFDMKRLSSSHLSEELKYQNEKLIVNFRTIYFIQNAFYESQVEEDSVVDTYTEEELSQLLSEGALHLSDIDIPSNEKENNKNIDYTVVHSKFKKAEVFRGQYLANYGKNYNYTLSLRKDENMCYMYLDAEIASFACYIPYVMCDDMLTKMFYILKSMEYDTTMIIKDYKLLYSLLLMEDHYEEENIYNEIIPESGYLEDLIQRQED